MADSTLELLDPSLRSPAPRDGSLPVRTLEDPDAGSDSDDEGVKEGDDGSTAPGKKRRKLNLWKCKQCRDARKKCLPEGRVWPQKCLRCIAHRPKELDCSEPEMNTRTRGKNAPKPKDKETKSSSRRSKTASIPDTSEPKRAANDIEDSDMDVAHDRPAPIGIKKNRERQGTSIEPTTEKKEPTTDKEQPPAALYLKLAERQFRILQLEPGKRDDILRCSFSVVSVDYPPVYEAISYAWGGHTTEPLTYRKIELLDDQRPPKSYFFFIRSVVHSALHSLRHPTKVRRFWVDALCIHRSNPEEINHQVAMKSLIFFNADNLCFWLGDEQLYKTAIAFIPKIVDLKEVDKLVDDQTMVDKWIAFVTLLKNNVFSRLWLIQEIAIAWNVTIHCGGSTIHYKDFVDAVTIFLSCRKHISALFRDNEKDPQILTDRKITIVERFIEITTNALQRDLSDRQARRKKLQRLLDLEALVSNLIDLSSGNHRDRIYSVLALAKDGPPVFDARRSTPGDTFWIDYGKSVLEVYQNFFEHVVTTSKTLDIMCRRWASCVPVNDEEHGDLPTWIRPLQSSPMESKVVERTDYDRTDADSLVGIPDHRWYNAAKNTDAKVQIKPSADPNEKKKVLLARGFRLDTIYKLGPRAAEGIILREWLTLGGCILSAEDDDVVPEPFWRTIVADRGPNGSNVPSWYRRAFLNCLADRSPNGDINTKNLLKTCEADSTLIVDFLQRVQSVIWNRKFLVSKENKWIGLAPMAAQEQDMICILHGCSVPLVLRENDVDGDTFWQVVGECYVNGMMDGEAMELAGRDPTATEEFEIR